MSSASSLEVASSHAEDVQTVLYQTACRTGGGTYLSDSDVCHPGWAAGTCSKSRSNDVTILEARTADETAIATKYKIDALVTGMKVNTLFFLAFYKFMKTYNYGEYAGNEISLMVGDTEDPVPEGCDWHLDEGDISACLMDKKGTLLAALDFGYSVKSGVLVVEIEGVVAKVARKQFGYLAVVLTMEHLCEEARGEYPVVFNLQNSCNPRPGCSCGYFKAGFELDTMSAMGKTPAEMTALMGAEPTGGFLNDYEMKTPAGICQYIFSAQEAVAKMLSEEEVTETARSETATTGSD